MSTGPMFDRIAARYDFLNRLLSLGQDKGWRQYTAKLLKEGPVLDLATGTGDLALAGLQSHPSWQFQGIDIAPGMLEKAILKKKAMGISDEQYSVQKGTAEAIPFEANRFGSVMIAFGIRNVENRLKALEESLRVLKRGGRMLVLEFSTPSSWWFRPIYQFYFSKILPRLAGLFSDRAAYQYLFESVQDFPENEAFCELMELAGFCKVRMHALTFGIVNLYLGEKAA